MKIQSEAQSVISTLNGWNKPAKIVPETELSPILRQEGTGCDCKGCDKD